MFVISSSDLQVRASLLYKIFVGMGCFLVLGSCSTTHAQTIDNINAQFDGEKIIITYDLTHSNAFEKFDVALYSSYDNFSQSLTRVTGASGENITAGKSKRVVWEVKNALPADFDAEISFRIKATKMKGPVLVLEPMSSSVYKKGRILTLTWTGAYPAELLTLELYKGNVFSLRVAENMANTGTYEWKIPKSVKGKNYMLRLTPTLRPEEQVGSQVFRVKPKTPFLVKALPILAAGGVFIILSGGSGGDSGGPPGNSVLPAPEKPGG